MLVIRTQNCRYFVCVFLVTLLSPTLVSRVLAQTPPPSNKAAYTKNSQDLNRRSSIEVDPSTLGLNISIPLEDYSGRGIALPISLSYSSKLWRIGYNGCRNGSHEKVMLPNICL